MADQDASTEKWRIIADAPDYAISDHGRVKRIVADGQGRGLGRVLTAQFDRDGYRRVCLFVSQQRSYRRVATLVCITFNGAQPSPKHEVAHDDGSRTNDVPENLFWRTRKENAADRDRHGRTARGVTQGLAKLNECSVKEILNMPKTWGSGLALAREFGVSDNTISQIRLGRIWKHV